MICPKCNNPIDENAIACPFCGTQFVGEAGATTVLDQGAMNYGYSAPQYAQPQYTQPQYAQPQYAARPAIQLATNRSALKVILLSLITFGIYGVVTYCKMVTDLNIAASRYDGKRTMPYLAMCSLMSVTFGILPLVWFHNMSERIGDELKRRGYDYKFSASDFWLWNVLGSLIIVGPIVYTHKLMKAMNMINESFNTYG